MSWLPYITMFLLMMIGLMLVFIILLQRGRGGGLAGALGGMGGQSAFGTKAGDMFTRITIGLAAVWMIVAVGNIYALQYTGKLYDGGSEATKGAGAVESDEKKDDAADLENAAKAAHSLMNQDGKKDDAAAEDKKPADDKKSDEAAAPEKKPEEAKTEPAKDDAAKPAESTEPAKAEEKTEKPAEPAAKPDEKKPE